VGRVKAGEEGRFFLQVLGRFRGVAKVVEGEDYLKIPRISLERSSISPIISRLTAPCASKNRRTIARCKKTRYHCQLLPRLTNKKTPTMSPRG
jgi:hypothetical protein